jgi:hypothetical protein
MSIKNLILSVIMGLSLTSGSLMASTKPVDKYTATVPFYVDYSMALVEFKKPVKDLDLKITSTGKDSRKNATTIDAFVERITEKSNYQLTNLPGNKIIIPPEADITLNYAGNGIVFQINSFMLMANEPPVVFNSADLVYVQNDTNMGARAPASIQVKTYMKEGSVQAATWVSNGKQFALIWRVDHLGKEKS